LKGADNKYTVFYCYGLGKSDPLAAAEKSTASVRAVVRCRANSRRKTLKYELVTPKNQENGDGMKISINITSFSELPLLIRVIR
tara:strand:+ start:387 stop:638 length:252 start_codon:yes stop_codon:yes gene_type:complete